MHPYSVPTALKIRGRRFKISQARKAGMPPSWYEATLHNELDTFCTCFDLTNRDAAVKSALPLVDQPLSVTTVLVRIILLRVNLIRLLVQIIYLALY